MPDPSRPQPELSFELDLSGCAASVDTYTVRGYCGNCGWSGRLILRKGNRAPGNKSLANVTRAPLVVCKKCGCKQVTAS